MSMPRLQLHTTNTLRPFALFAAACLRRLNCGSTFSPPSSPRPHRYAASGFSSSAMRFLASSSSNWHCATRSSAFRHDSCHFIDPSSAFSSCTRMRSSSVWYRVSPYLIPCAPQSTHLELLLLAILGGQLRVEVLHLFLETEQVVGRSLEQDALADLRIRAAWHLADNLHDPLVDILAPAALDLFLPVSPL